VVLVVVVIDDDDDDLALAAHKIGCSTSCSAGSGSSARTNGTQLVAQKCFWRRRSAVAVGSSGTSGGGAAAVAAVAAAPVDEFRAAVNRPASCAA
jgi:hypothetical protein